MTVATCFWLRQNSSLMSLFWLKHYSVFSSISYLFSGPSLERPPYGYRLSGLSRGVVFRQGGTENSTLSYAREVLYH